MTPSDARPGPAPATRPPVRRPPALRPGDRVAVLSVSSPAPPAQLAVGLDVLRFAGLDPVLYPSAQDQGSMRRYLAGDDQMRTADLRAALTDPGIAGVIFATGGSGAQRTLETMDWGGIAGLPPKVLAGYSDVTAVLEAVACKLGWASLLSPMVVSSGAAIHYSVGSMLRALMHPERATDVRYPMASRVVGGTARGVTLGGNLTLLASSLGTDTSWPARGGILLVEEQNEADYRLDRMLTQLRRSGYLDGVAGIVAGTFVGCGEPASVEEILAERLGSLGVPMITWANVGHGGYFQAFPIGVAAELDADAAALRLLEPPLLPVSRGRRP
jgi:muramoyltetrapeptide carboxypeptidase